MEPPKNLPDLLEKAAKITKDVQGVYGVGVRGSRSWATIHPGFLSGYANFGANGLRRRGRQAQGGDEQPRSQGLHQPLGQDDPGERAEELGHLHLVPGRHRPRRRRLRHDLRRRHPGLLHERDGNKEAGNIAYTAFAPNPQAQAPTPNVWIWSLGMTPSASQTGCRLDLHPVGQRRRARPVRRAQDGLRQPGPPGGLGRRGVPRSASPSATPATWSSTRLGAAARRSTSRRSRCSSTSPPSGRPPCRRWWPRRSRSTRASTSWPPASTISSSRPASADPRTERPGDLAGSPRASRALHRARTAWPPPPAPRPPPRPRAGSLRPRRPALPPEPAGAPRLHRHPHPVLHRGLLLAAALQPRDAVHPRLHLVRQLHRLPHRPRVLEHGHGLAALHRPHRRRRAGAGPRHRHAPARGATLVQQRLEHRPHAAADDRPRHRRP